jgi:glucuronate isomerase
MNVKVVCTTDDPVDSLEHHARLRADPFPVTVVPTFRPDAAMAVENPSAFNAWTARLSAASRIEVTGWAKLVEALRARHASFHEMGCRASDHGIEEPWSDDCTDDEAERIFQALRSGTSPDQRAARAWKSAVMRELGRMDAEKGWVMQLHMGALRDINSRFMRALGPNSGFDTIGDFGLARPLARFLDRLDAEGRLPKSILYCLNPAWNTVLASIIGSFPQENVRGKMQFGPAWWYNDQKHGMQEQMRVLADMGMLPRFVGMLTDSRSFLSFPRHEYFRRILCAMLGEAIEAGEAPADYELMGGIVRDICGRNAEEYFGFPLKALPGTA